VNDRAKYRLRDIANAIDDIDSLLSGKSFSDVQADRFMRAAFERFLEIISEASRHVPDALTKDANRFPGRGSGRSAIISDTPTIASMQRYSGIHTRKANSQG
jgi:uncharacterized protein with HEPN domain